MVNCESDVSRSLQSSLVQRNFAYSQTFYIHNNDDETDEFIITKIPPICNITLTQNFKNSYRNLKSAYSLISYFESIFNY